MTGMELIQQRHGEKGHHHRNKKNRQTRQWIPPQKMECREDCHQCREEKRNVGGLDPRDHRRTENS